MPSTTASRPRSLDPAVALLFIVRERKRRARAGEHGPRFYGAALDLLESTAPEVVISGPAGTGKSFACLAKLHRISMTVAGTRCLILRKTRESLSTTGLVTFEERVLGRDHWMVTGGPNRRNRQSYSYPNGSEIVCGGLDKATKVLSADYDVIYVQQVEELTEAEWETLSSRCRNAVLPYQQLIGDCNPERPQHWLRRRSQSGQTPMLESHHEDNPSLFDHATGEITARGKDYMERLDKLTGVRYLRLRKGVWAAAEGAVFADEWDKPLHVQNRDAIPDPIPYDWPRLMVVDFGYENPFVCQWWARDNDDRWYRYREIYMTQRTVRAHAELMKAKNAEEESRVRQAMLASGMEAKKVEEWQLRFPPVVCDHDAEGRATLVENGFETIAAVKDVQRGIEAVRHRLAKRGDGTARIIYLRDSLVEADEKLMEAGKPYATEQEFDGYHYPKGGDGKPLKEVPVKEDDHGIDATRYMVAHVDGLGGEDPVAGWMKIVDKFGRPV
jgi:hypothetical protein